jgi:hypothetical protein
LTHPNQQKDLEFLERETEITLALKTMKEKENSNMENKMTVLTSNKPLCPFIQKPFEGCYCTSTNSLYTEATIHYCGGHFRQCEIYGKNIDRVEIQ